MPKRNSKPKRPKRPSDINQLAHELVRESTESVNEPVATQSEISRVMREMGRRGGKIGGKRRLETMTPEQRSEVALKAAKTRWAKKASKEPAE